MHTLNERIRAVREFSQVMPGNYRIYCSPPHKLIQKNPDNWRWAEEKWQSCNIFAHGLEGTGKSSLCRYLITERMAQRYPDVCGEVDVYPYIAFDLPCTELQDAASGSGWEASQRLDHMVDRAKHCGVLLLDDMHVPRWSRQGLNVLRSILDRRHECKSTTFFTSNLSMPPLGEMFQSAYGGDRQAALTLTRRMRPFKELEFKGTSYRYEMEIAESEL